MFTKVLSGILTSAVLMGAAMPASASGFGTTMNIEVKGTEMNITVPTSMDFVLNADETNTYPETFTIQNNSGISGVYVDSIDFTQPGNASSNGWEFLKEGYDTLKLPADSKAIVFELGLPGDLKDVAPTGGVERAETGKAVFGEEVLDLAAGEEKTFAFNIKRGAFTSDAVSEHAFDATINFEFKTK